MAKKRSRGHVFVETDGQVFLVRERGKYRFPRVEESLPFRTDPNGIMDFGEDRVVKRTPRLDHHPEEWMGRDSVFERTDVDPLVKRAIYTTMIRCVSEVILSKGSRVLMVKAVRGYSKGYWNIPGGFMDYGEGPEAGAEREAKEEIGAEVVLDGLLNVYVSGFLAAVSRGSASVAGEKSWVVRGNGFGRRADRVPGPRRRHKSRTTWIRPH